MTLMNRREAVQSLAALAALASTTRRAGAATVNPLALPLVTSGTPLFTYLGSFKGPSDGAFKYGAGAMSVSGSSLSSRGNLYANGLQQGTPCLGLMKIPSPSGANGAYTGSETATTVVAPKQINFGGCQVTTGSLAYNNRLFVTGAVTYDATGSQNVFLAPMNTDMSGQGAPCGANGSAGSKARMFSNSMGLVPAVWQPYLGGPGFIAGGPGGMGGLSIISQQCCGYGFSTFNPDSVVAGSNVAIKEWINWPYDTQGTGRSNHVSALWPAGIITNKSNFSSSNPGNNYVSEYDRPIGCAFIPDGSRSLLFLHWHSYGPQSGAGSSPCGSGASGSYETPVSPDTAPYIRMQIVAFDLAQVIASRNAGGAVTAVLPYAWWEFPNWQSVIGAASSCPINASWPGNAWAAYDPTAQSDGSHLMYWNDNFSGTNGQVFVFKVASLGTSSGGGTATPTVPAAPTNVQVT